MDAALKTKHEELEKVRVRVRAILAEYPNGLPAEQEMACNALMEKAGELKTAIDTDTKLEQKKAELADLDRYLSEPVHQVRHGINQDDDSRKSLLAAGWEVKGGMVYGPTSIEGSRYRGFDGEWHTVGKTAMYPEEVLFGDIPTDDEDAARYFRKTRAIFGAEYKHAYGKYLKNCVKYRSEALAMQMMSPSEQKALSEGTDTAGGFLVPPDIMSEVQARLPQQAVFRQFATVQATSRDVLKYPAAKANAGTYNSISGASIYASGFVGAWAGETPAFSDTDPSFQTLDIPVKKLRVATKLSNDFVADSATNVLAWLAQNGAENMALTEDLGFIQGDGSALQPLGLLNIPGIPTTSIEGSTSHTVSNTISNTGTAPKLITLAYSLPAQYVSRARMLMRRTIEGSIRGLVDASGRFLWPAQTESAFAAVGGSLLGFPISHSDWMPADGTATNNVVVLGDLSKYIIAQRTQITSVVLRERFADTDQIGIILFERVGGNCFNYDAFRLGYV